MKIYAVMASDTYYPGHDNTEGVFASWDEAEKRREALEKSWYKYDWISIEELTVYSTYEEFAESNND